MFETIMKIFSPSENRECREKRQWLLKKEKITDIEKFFYENLRSDMAITLKGVLDRTTKTSRSACELYKHNYIEVFLGAWHRRNRVSAYVFFDINNTPMFSLHWPNSYLDKDDWARKTYIEKCCFKVNDVLPLMDKIIRTKQSKEIEEEKRTAELIAVREFITGTK